MSEKLSSFSYDAQTVLVRFIETQTVKEGVECDVYAFVDDASRDLAVVRVQKGYKTPLQRVITGNKTIEGFSGGNGTLIVKSVSGDAMVYDFPSYGTAVEVQAGQTMQWQASNDADLVFYEICDPPYQSGRFEDLPE